MIRSLLYMLVFLLWSSVASAAFIDWWLTPDQQGRWYFEQGDYQRAAQRFTDPYRKGLAYYAAEDFSSAAAMFATVDTPEGRFYLGNAYAQQDMLAEAVVSFDAALKLRSDFEAAQFNRDWVAGILEIENREYEDAGGTGGKLGADEIVFDDKAQNAQGEMTQQEAIAEGLSDQQLQEMWMRRVQTTPGDFLELKFAYQLQKQGGAVADAE
ncbi:MAG: tetratricopeptide repeat protein [Gammaproteobacteria bacterium]